MSLLLTRSARRRLGTEPGGTVSGRLAVGGLAAARRLAERLSAGMEGPALSAGQLNAYSLLEEALDLVVALCLDRQPELFSEALAWLDGQLGEGHVDRVLDRFAEELTEEPAGEPAGGPAEPSAAQSTAARSPGIQGEREAVRPEAGAADRAGGAAPAPGRRNGGSAQRRRLLRGLLVFWLLDANSGLRRVTSILHSEGPASEPGWALFAAALAEFLAARPAPALPGFGRAGEVRAPDGAGPPRAGSLLELLQAPARHSPDSLASQLRFVLERWRPLPASTRGRIVSGLDLLAEEERPRFPPGPGPTEVPPTSELAAHEARYSPDVGWMPGLVLVAKNLAVWLDQLSRTHGRSIRRLDEIPEAALAELVERGFSGLWLIGVWERSPASKRIKRLCGSREAGASAYSVRAYRVAAGLGGEEALAILTARAARHGLRLAADMIPNHMGIDSEWVIEHPERFLSLAECPYPSYSFGGPDLSSDPRVGIFLEDHYYDRTDAAVVFKRLDRPRRQVRYLYHGNDGTSTPWNDTAQLDHMDPATREAVIRTILEVARRFPIVRFDAAMTLARRHYQRLWHPLPGSGGAIPSRAEHALSQEAFDRRMPAEFWRQVVDRVAAEAPGTLLLAEAFWLTEGYFVRTLGMHRVYNSAFMNMLRDQQNADFRRLLRETLDFDPRILGRWVNFMSNPDEQTAVEQFGTGDRYFGICVLLATLPGLPMFAHGQVEGFTERYGMEFGRAHLAEEPDPGLIERHQRQIVPLLRRRAEFAAAENFHLFDLVDEDGAPREAVIAFVTGAPGRRLLVVFHNRAATVRGRLLQSAPRRRPDGELESETLAAALGLPAGRTALWRYRDELSGLEFLRPDAGGRGLELELGPYGTSVLSGFEALTGEAAERTRPLAERLGLGGVPDLDRALTGLRLEPARRRLDQLLAGLVAATGPDKPGTVALEPLAADFRRLEAELRGAGLLAEDEHLPDPLPGWRAVLELPLLAARRTVGAPPELSAGGGRPALTVGEEPARGGPGEERPGTGAAERGELADGSSETAAGGMLPWPGAGRSQREVERLVDWIVREPVVAAALGGGVLLASLRAGGADLTGRLAAREALAGRLAALAPGVEESAERAASLAARAAAAGWLRPQPPPGPDELADLLPAWASSLKGEVSPAVHRPGAPAPATPEPSAPERRAPRLEIVEELLNWRLATAAIAQIAAAVTGADPVEAAQTVIGWSLATGRLRPSTAPPGDPDAVT